MNREEATMLARLVRAMRPQQPWDEATPQAWSLLLTGTRYADAEAAITNLGGTSTFIDVPAILTEVKRLRAERITRGEARMPVYPGDPDDVMGELAWRRDMRRRLADGEVIPNTDALVERAMPRLDAVWQRPPQRDDPKPAAPRPVLREPEAAFRAELKREGLA